VRRRLAQVHANPRAFAKYWLRVLTEIKNRGLGDVLIVVCDGLTGLPDVKAGPSKGRRVSDAPSSLDTGGAAPDAVARAGSRRADLNIDWLPSLEHRGRPRTNRRIAKGIASRFRDVLGALVTSSPTTSPNLSTAIDK
jgi:hypothetical protein